MLNFAPAHTAFKPGDAASFVACYHPDAKQRANGQWLVCCPAHDDKQPSLSIGQGDKGITFKCFAGCEFDAICKAYPIERSQTFKPNERPQLRPVNRHPVGRIEYLYRDEQGHQLYRKVRVDYDDGDKSYPQDRWENGRWVNGLGNVRRVLYRLPELLKADPGEPVYWVEGEKCCEDLARRGLVSTTSGSADSWRDDFAPFLAGRVVVILPDNDAPGREHAETVARSLSAVASWVSIVHLPGLAEKQDVYDWLRTGYTVDDLVELAAAADAWQPTPAPVIPFPAPAPAPTTPPGKAHDELRDAWIAQFPPTAYSMGSFQRYDAGIWRPIEETAIKSEILTVLEAAKSEGVKVTGSLLSSVCGLATAKLYRPSTVWDADPSLLVCQNGVLNLESREFRPHDPLDYATRRAPYDYDPAAVAPAWLYVLGCLPDELALFLQEWAGYCLTTDTSQELAVWLYGPPGSGKSTYITGLQAMLGDKAGYLSLRDIERSRFALTGLPGKTLVVATEAPEHYITATDVINTIVSGEPLQVEVKFRDAYMITPRAKITWAMNALPRIGNPEDGIFRRVKIVEFPPIASEDRDPTIKETIKTEGPGIVNWALDGLERLRNRGRFDVPRLVTDATDHFKANNDIPALFVAECCITGHDKQVKGDPLYAAYRQWCERNGYKPLASNNAAEEWRRLGFKKDRKAAGVVWSGLGLLETV